MIGKKILRDPKLSQLASRKFNTTIDQFDDSKFLFKNAIITDLIE